MLTERTTRFHAAPRTSAPSNRATSFPATAATAFALALATALLPTPARAEDYGADVHIETEDDLYDLHQQGALEDDEFETLVDLFDEGVDLNSATRDDLYALPTLTWAQVDAILEYRKLDGYIEDPKALVEAGAISAEQLSEIAPFLILSDRGSRIPLSGKASLRGKYSVQDPVGPPLLLKSRLKLPYDLVAGFALTTTRKRIGTVRYDENRDLLLAAPAQYSLYFPKYFAQWKSTNRSITVGTFRLGFAERLTLDNSRRPRPDGVYADDVVYNKTDLATYCAYSGAAADEACAGLQNLRATPDFTWPDSFRGIAAHIDDLAIGSTRVDLTAFGSYQSHSVYQYQLFDKRNCDDPRSDSKACSAPYPYSEGPTGLQQFSYTTLPDLWDELAGGGNATVAIDERTKFGATGYYAVPLWHIPQLDFQDYAKYPWGGAFGAIGVNGATKFGPVNLYAEAARSFDHETGGKGGGYAVEQRTVYSQKHQELEVSLRYYDRDFINPYAHAISGSDQLEGQRVRNELGARVKYFQTINEDWRVRGMANVWTLPYDGKNDGTAGALNFEGSARGDFKGWEFFQAGAWANLAYKTINPCTGQLDAPSSIFNPVDTADTGDSGDSGDSTSLADACDPKYVRLSARAAVLPFGPRVAFAVQPSYKRLLNAGRQDGNVWFEVAVRPIDQLRLRVKTRYYDIDLGDADDTSERTSWTWADVTWAPTRLFLARLRYDALVYLDHRDSTLSRRPNPEHRLQLLLESRF